MSERSATTYAWKFEAEATSKMGTSAYITFYIDRYTRDEAWSALRAEYPDALHIDDHSVSQDEFFAASQPVFMLQEVVRPVQAIGLEEADP